MLNKIFYEVVKKYYDTCEKKLRSRNGIGNNVIFCGPNSIDNESTIGDYSYIGRNCVITRSCIGRYCSIADNVTIGPGEHDISRCSTNTRLYSHRENISELLTSKDVVIKNDVWIGCNAVIRRGVIIGNGAVIGSNSFVNSDVPDFAVVVGSPARIIKYRFSREIINYINFQQWWNLDIDEARAKVSVIDSYITENGV